MPSKNRNASSPLKSGLAHGQLRYEIVCLKKSLGGQRKGQVQGDGPKIDTPGR